MDEQQQWRRTAAIYAGTTVATAAYATWLETYKRSYEPNWTWVTVVGGNAILGMSFLAICIAAPPTKPSSFFWHLVGVNIAGGMPIILWQLWKRGEDYREEIERQDRRRTTYAGQ
jgi:Na+-transporting NADH:ubiquinone oxidoreductase subunit NqrB